jgi:hypothetical protein
VSLPLDNWIVALKLRKRICLGWMIEKPDRTEMRVLRVGPRPIPYALWIGLNQVEPPFQTNHVIYVSRRRTSSPPHWPGLTSVLEFFDPHSRSNCEFLNNKQFSSEYGRSRAWPLAQFGVPAERCTDGH